MLEAVAIIVARDAALASSLELTLLAAGLPVALHDPAQGLESLALDRASILIVEEQVLKPDAPSFIAALRTRLWSGLVILITGDATLLRGVFEAAYRVTVLEMPFQGADLIAAIRAEWPDPPR
jgi:FixJ family two-component response regulator